MQFHRELKRVVAHLVELCCLRVMQFHRELKLMKT